MSKILALDVGEKRVGVAISDEMGVVARPFDVLNYFDSIKKILVICEEEDIKKIVVGLPRQMSGEESENVGFIKKFIEDLKEKINNIEFEYEDETGTSLEAEKRLKERGVNFRKDKGEVDKEAATVILESYLNK